MARGGLGRIPGVVQAMRVVEFGVISESDLKLFKLMDDPKEAFDYITGELEIQRKLHSEFYRKRK